MEDGPVRLLALVHSPEHVCCRYRLAAFQAPLQRAGHTLELHPRRSEPLSPGGTPGPRPGRAARLVGFVQHAARPGNDSAVAGAPGTALAGAAFQNDLRPVPLLAAPARPSGRVDVG